MMRRKSIALLSVGMLWIGLWGPASHGADPPKKGKHETSTEVAIRNSAAKFVEAFNRGDAKAVAAHWAKDGEYIDETGRQFQGQAAIAAEYTRLFKEHPKVQIRITINSIRQVGDDVVLEEGRATLDPMPAGAPHRSRYSAVHAKQNGRWKMVRVRDTRIAVASNHAHLADLAWLIGSWHAEGGGVDHRSTYRWIAGKNFIQRTYEVTEAGQVRASGTQIIGWDPLRKQITSQIFTSEGGTALGLWTPGTGAWTIASKGVLADGTRTTAVNQLVRLEGDAVAWRSTDRSAGGIRLPDAQEIVLKREKK